MAPVTAAATDPLPEVMRRLGIVREQLEGVALLLRPLGMLARVLISLETPDGSHRQWKISTEERVRAIPTRVPLSPAPGLRGP